MVKQLSIFVSNEMGGMKKITKILTDNKVDIRALSIADTSDFGVLRLIVDRPEDALEGLKAQGVTASLTDVIAVEVSDEPGGLHKIVSALADGGVDLEYIYAFLHPGKDHAYVIVKATDEDAALKTLAEHNVSVVESGELYNL